jgi:SnoaL-like domain
VEDLGKRSAREVLDDHLGIANRWGPDQDLEDIVAEDLRRNVSEEIVILMNRGTFHGHAGVMELAEMLGEELPERRAFAYTYVAAEGKIALLEWAYDDARVSVSDGADSYLIEDGKIVAQTIHYTVVSKDL